VHEFSDGLLDEFADGRKKAAARRGALFPSPCCP
jgi:hypothetical protein